MAGSLLNGALDLSYKSELIAIVVICFGFNLQTNGQSIGTPTSATVCDGSTATLVCDITQSGGDIPLWRVFATSDTSGSPVATLVSGDNSPPYNYPAVQAGDTVARLEVMASSSIDGYHFQCRLLLAPPVDSPGTGTITVTDTPSCPTSISANRDDDFTSANVTYQLATPPPGTSTTVTYCPTSSPNCGNSMNCTSTSTCTISGLNACDDYQLTVVPNNNCGIPTGCTGNSVISEGQDVPSCASGVNATNILASNLCLVSLTWQQPPNTPPVTSTTVTYCPTSSPNCGNSVTCTIPCIIGGLDPGTEYQFTVIPNNNCGSPTGCTGNTATVTTCVSCIASYRQPSEGVSTDAACGISLGIGVAVPIAVLIVVNIISVVVVFLITRHCYKKTSQKSSPSKGERVYEQVEGQKSYDDIMMADNPAYGPVK